MTNIAVILAGGIGARVGGQTPKQLLPLADGRSILQTCIDTFRACTCIDEVVVVMHPDWMDEVHGVRVIAGGKERWESSWNAINALPVDSHLNGQPVNVLIHDAARPFVSQRIIEDVCRALETHEAVTVAVPATDTMYSVKASSLSDVSSQTATLVDIPDRATMWRAQTPQAFRLELIRNAYNIALQETNLQATDDCGIVHRYMPQATIHIVTGEEANRKITYKEDLK